MSGRRAVALVTAATLASVAVAAGGDVPYLRGRVTDDAEVLSAETRRELAARLQEYESRTGAQVVVLTVTSLGGASIEDYADAVFSEWKLGRRGVDDGILLVVAPSERRMRIEVGYGLEAKMTDLAAGRIIRNVMTPRFREGDFDGGVTDGVSAILDQLEGRALPPGDDAGDPAASDGARRSSGLSDIQPDLGLIERILFGAFIFGIIGLFTVIGVLTPGAGWFLYFFLIPFWAAFPIVVLGTHGAFYLLVTYVLAFPLVKLGVSRTAWYAKAKKELATKGSARVGGFTLGSGGSSWSSGGSSGGSFSGGGGSSGGGGASGSW